MEISYVIFLCDYKSPYNAYNEVDKPRIIKEDFIKNHKWEPDQLILDAIKKYEELQQTTNTRLLRSAKKGAEKLAEYFENVDFSETDDYGKPKYTAKDLASNLGAVGNIVKSLTQLERQVQSEQVEVSNVRGNSGIGEYEVIK